MENILSRLFNILKYILLIAAFALTFYGIIVTYNRLEKSLVDAIPVFIPFLTLFIMFVVNLFIKDNGIKNNLLFNFTCCLVLSVLIIVVLRSKFDMGMILYHKYKIDFNPLYFSDNLATFNLMLYGLTAADLFLLLANKFSKKEK